MRICIVAREPFGPRSDFPQRGLLMRALVHAGHEVHLLTSRDLRFEGVSVHCVAHEQGLSTLPGFDCDATRYAWALHEVLTELHERHSFAWIDLPSSAGEGAFALQAQQLSGAFPGALMSVRVTPSARARREFNREFSIDLPTLAFDQLERTSMRLGNLLIGPSAGCFEDHPGCGAVRDRQIVVPTPMHPSMSTAQATERGGPTVVYLGPLDHRSGGQTLVAAGVALLERGHSLQVELRGVDTATGPFGRSFSGWLRRQIPPQWTAHIRVLETPECPDTASVAGTVFCFPWLGAPETEACLTVMAQGRAVIHSDAWGAEGLAGAGSALTFARGDVESLAACLAELLGDPVRLDSIARTARDAIAREHAPERVVSLLERLISPSPGPSPAPSSRRPPVGPKPRVSVIVPFFNLHELLPATLASVDAQTYTDFELIIVDDGSTAPESVSLLDALEREGRRVIHKRNGGLSSARNAGLAVAKGDWVLPLDADDLIAPTFLERTAAALERDPTLAYATTFVSRFVSNPAEAVGVYLPWGLERDILHLTNVASTCTALISRAVLEEVGGYDEWLTSFEDWDLYCTLAGRGLRGAVVPEFLFHYRTRPDSLVHTEVLQRRNALRAYLIAKHPRLAEQPDLTLRAMLGEHETQLADRPLRYRAIDAVNDGLRRLPWVHPMLKRGLDLAKRARAQR